MTDPLTARLSELLAKATPGPWIVDPFQAWISPVPDLGSPICAMRMETDGVSCAAHARVDADLIVEAINALPTLLAERAILIAEREEARALLEPFASVLDDWDSDEDDNTPGTFVGGSVTNYDLCLADFRTARAYLTRTEDHG